MTESADRLLLSVPARGYPCSHRNASDRMHSVVNDQVSDQVGDRVCDKMNYVRKTTRP